MTHRMGCHAPILVLQSDANLGAGDVHTPETLAMSLNEPDDGPQDFLVRDAKVVHEVDRI